MSRPLASVTVPCSRCGQEVPVEVTSIRRGKRGLLVAEAWEQAESCACPDGVGQPDQSLLDDRLSHGSDYREIVRDLDTMAEDASADARYRVSIGD